jgi:hypothetical protein
MPRISIPRIVRSDPEASGLVACFVAAPGGMIDLVTGSWGTRAGSADPMRSTNFGTLESYFDGVGDNYNFGATAVISTGAPFTIVVEAFLDAFVDAFPTYCALCNETANSYLVFLNTGATYGDLTFGSGGTSWSRFRASLTGVAGLSGERHWLVVTYNGAGATTQSNFACYLNGASLALSGSGSLSGTTNDNRVGGSSLSTTDWNGSIRQVRVYDRVWSEAEAVRFWHPATRDSLYTPNRRPMSRAAFAAAAGGFQPAWATNSNVLLMNGRAA